MRTALLMTGGLAGVFFTISFVLTFLARAYLTRLARDFVVERTQEHADPLVEIADQAVRAPGIKRIFSDEQLQTARNEIDAYREGPREYIVKLVAGNGNPSAAAPGPNAAMAERVTHWKWKVRVHFEATLNRLLRDLRIFLGSNATAAWVAFAAAWWGRRGRLRGLPWIGVLLLASMTFSIYMYIDEFSYFKILFNSYMGWWYPVVLAVTFLGLVIEHGRSERRIATSDVQSAQ